MRKVTKQMIQRRSPPRRKASAMTPVWGRSHWYNESHIRTKHYLCHESRIPKVTSRQTRLIWENVLKTVSPVIWRRSDRKGDTRQNTTDQDKFSTHMMEVTSKRSLQDEWYEAVHTINRGQNTICVTKVESKRSHQHNTSKGEWY